MKIFQQWPNWSINTKWGTIDVSEITDFLGNELPKPIGRFHIIQIDPTNEYGYPKNGRPSYHVEPGDPKPKSGIGRVNAVALVDIAEDGTLQITEINEEITNSRGI